MKFYPTAALAICILFTEVASTSTASAQTSGSNLSFAPPIVISAPVTFPQSIASGDFNNDGIQDLTVVGSTNGIIGVAFGKGDGNFGPWIGSPASYAPDVVAVGKFDGQNLDAVVNDAAYLNAWVMLGDGTGHFPNSTFLDLNGAFTYGFAVGDFNGDQKDDLAVTDSIGNVYIFLSNGDGTFQGPQIFPTGGLGPGPAIAGDFNGDGILDLAVLNLDNTGPSESLAVLLGKGDGTFGPPHVVQFPTPAVGFNLAAGEFDGDKELDLAVTVTTHTSKTEFAAILLGNGNGSFKNGSVVNVGPSYGSIATADFNGDGKLDLVLADENSNFAGYISILLGNGDGTFQPPIYFAVNSEGTNELTVADFNGDGKPDVATVNTKDSTVSILLNTTTPWPAKLVFSTERKR